jgi:hypothetical protein
MNVHLTRGELELLLEVLRQGGTSDQAVRRLLAKLDGYREIAGDDAGRELGYGMRADGPAIDVFGRPWG